MTDPIPLIDVRAHQGTIGEEINKNLAAVVAHGQWVMGPEVHELEQGLEAFIGVDDVQAISCSNGTDALMLAIQALGLLPGQAVICPAFTFVATAEAVAVLGGTPVFADVEPLGFNLSPESVQQAAKTAQESGLQIAGICAVDLFGAPANYGELQATASELGVWLLSDSAQGFGCTFDGVRAGALAAVTTTSFFPAKPLGCYGDGGAVFTRDGDVADLLRSLRVHGQGSDRYDNVRIGQNARLDTMQAAVLLPKLGIFADELAARNRIAACYHAALDGVVRTPTIPEGSTSSWAQYTIVSERRDAIKAALDAASIGNAIYYSKPLHMQDGYVDFHLEGVELTRTNWLSSRVLSLPMHPYLTDNQVERVIETVTSAACS